MASPPEGAGPFRRWLDRTVLALLMGVAVWFVDRRLRKALSRSVDQADEPKQRERVVEIG